MGVGKGTLRVGGDHQLDPIPQTPTQWATHTGGFFKETYRSGATAGASKGLTDEGGALMETAREPPKRNLLTSIYYMCVMNAGA